MSHDCGTCFAKFKSKEELAVHRQLSGHGKDTDVYKPSLGRQMLWGSVGESIYKAHKKRQAKKEGLF